MKIKVLRYTRKYMRKEMGSIRVHQYPETNLWGKSSSFLTGYLERLVRQDESVLVFLSGGSVVRMYPAIGHQLSVISSRLSVSKKIAFAQVDERFQPNQLSEIRNQLSVKNEINAYQIEQTGLWKACDELGIPYYLISQKGSLKSATDSYSKETSLLWERYEKKIGILGIGEDGHTAGLLPGYRDLWDTERRKNKGNTGDKGNKGDSGGLVVGYRNEGTFPQRISLTLAAIRMLDAAVVVATGENKKQALQSIVNPANKESINTYPGVILQDIPHVDLFTDQTIIV